MGAGPPRRPRIDPPLLAGRRLRVARVGTSITLNMILRNQMRTLDEDDFEIICVCDPDEWAAELRALGFRVWPIGMGRRPGPLQATLWAMRFFRALKRQPVQIVHTHNAFHGIVGRIVARLAGVPIVVHTVHNWFYLYPPRAPRARLFRALERLAVRFCDRVFFLNSDDFRDAAEQGILAADKRCLIGNGVDTEAFSRELAAADRAAMRTELGLSEGDLVVTMVARLEPPKDNRLFLESFAELLPGVPNARALLVGHGLERARVEQDVRRLGLGRHVRLLGYREDIAALLKASDILVLASKHEGFGRALVEGMLAGLPVVGTDVVGIREVVQHERTGLLVPPGDRAALTTCLRRLVDDPAGAAKLAQAGRAYALEHFDERKVALRVGQVYRELLARRCVLAPASGKPALPG